MIDAVVGWFTENHYTILWGMVLYLVFFGGR